MKWAREGHGFQRLRKNSQMRALAWKSGASAPRKAPKSARASAPVVACVYSKFFRNVFQLCPKEPIKTRALASEVLLAPALIATLAVSWVFIPVTRRHIPRLTYLTLASKSVPHGTARGRYRQRGPGET